ncbi:MAG TPA: M48 family metalloprotease, partial [Leptospiraceae bacterium]|nr:M48 family metalloprotease [Leptospiraceae bacterium]
MLDRIKIDFEDVVRQKIISHPNLKKMKKNIDDFLSIIPYDFHLKKYQKTALEVNRASHPKLFSYIDDVAGQFQIKANIRVFKAREMTGENALISADKDNVLIVFCDNILNLINSELELKSIIGHEFGHYLFKHHEKKIEKYLQGIAGMFPEEAINNEEKKYARSAENTELIDMAFIISQISELNADRVGLLACGDLDAAIVSGIKLSAGKIDQFGTYSASYYLDQAEGLMNNEDPFDDEDFRSTHPLEKLRAYALNYFYHSDVFKELTGKGSGTNRLNEFNNIIHKIIPILPVNANSESTSKVSSTSSEKITQMDPYEYELFRYMAVHHVVSIDGKITKAESEMLCNFIKEDEIYNKVLAFSENASEDEYKKTYESLAKKACGLDSRVKTSIIKLMIKAAKADRKIADEEIGA